MRNTVRCCLLKNKTWHLCPDLFPCITCISYLAEGTLTFLSILLCIHRLNQLLGRGNKSVFLPFGMFPLPTDWFIYNYFSNSFRAMNSQIYANQKALLRNLMWVVTIQWNYECMLGCLGGKPPTTCTLHPKRKACLRPAGYGTRVNLVGGL